MVEPRDKIDGKDFAMLRSNGKKKKKKSMMGRYSLLLKVVEVFVWE